MNLIAQAICSSTLVLAGTALIVAGLLVNGSRDTGVAVGWTGVALLAFGVYSCCRVIGIKLYSSQAAWNAEPPAVRTA